MPTSDKKLRVPRLSGDDACNTAQVVKTMQTATECDVGGSLVECVPGKCIACLVDPSSKHLLKMGSMLCSPMVLQDHSSDQRGRTLAGFHCKKCSSS